MDTCRYLLAVESFPVEGDDEVKIELELELELGFAMLAVFHNHDRSADI